jgi:WD40 repeat protein
MATGLNGLGSRVFVSYARSDDEQFAILLARELRAAGTTVWLDRDAMPSRGRTFRQEIREAIAGIDRLVLVVGPAATESPQVTAEWQQALESCKVVIPVLRVGGASYVPAALAMLHRVDARPPRTENAVLAELRRIVQEPIPPLGRVDGADRLPEHFMQRPAELERIGNAVLADLRRPVVLMGRGATTALLGLGGLGKSVLAAAFARSCEARRAFGDGIIWIRLGQEPDLRGALIGVGRALGDDQLSAYLDVAGAQARIAELLTDRMCLLVVDDVWEIAHIEPFVNVLNDRSRMLMTTRQGTLLTALGACEIELDVLTPEQARDLFADWTGRKPGELPAEASAIFQECGYLPFAIALCGAMARDGLPLSHLLMALRAADLAFIERRLPNYPYLDVQRAMQASVDFLGSRDPVARQRYFELAVFPPGASIPEAAIRTLWGRGGAMADRDVAKLLVRLDRSAMLSLDGPQDHRIVTLHDLQHDYLRALVTDSVDLHRTLLDAYSEKSPDGWATGPDDGYFFQQLAYHLAAAGRQEDLRLTLSDSAWLEAKLAATGPGSLLADYELAERCATDAGADASAGVQIIRAALMLSASTLERYPEQVASQLAARLTGIAKPEVVDFLARLESTVRRPWFKPLAPALPAPGRGSISWQVSRDGSIDAIDIDQSEELIRSRDAYGDLRYWDLKTGSHIPESRVSLDVRNRNLDDHVIRRTFHGIDILDFPGLPGLESQLELRAFLAEWLEHGRPEAEVEDDEWRERRNRGYWMLNRSLTLAAPDGSWEAITVNTARVHFRGVGATFVCVLVLGTRDELHPLIVVQTHRGEKEADIALRGGLPSALPAVTSLAVAPDGSILGAGCADGRIRSWRLPALEPLAEIDAAPAMITALASAPEGQFVYGTIDGRVGIVQHLADGQPSRPQLDDAPEDIVLARSGQRALCLGESGTISLWDMETCRQLWRLAKDELAPDSSQWQLSFHSVALSADGEFAALYIIDQDMYGGMGVLGIHLDTARLTLLFDVNSGPKSRLSEEIGVGLRMVVTQPDGSYVAVTANGTALGPVEGTKRSLTDLGSGGVEGPRAHLLRPYSGIALGPLLRLAEGDPMLLELIENQGTVRARFSLDEPLAVAQITAASQVVSASVYGRLTFLRLTEPCPGS